MEQITYISESTVSDDNPIYIPDLEDPKGKDFSVPIAGSWSTIAKLVEKNCFIVSIAPLDGNVTRWKIIVSPFDVSE